MKRAIGISLVLALAACSASERSAHESLGTVSQALECAAGTDHYEVVAAPGGGTYVIDLASPGGPIKITRNGIVLSKAPTRSGTVLRVSFNGNSSISCQPAPISPYDKTASYLTVEIDTATRTATVERYCRQSYHDPSCPGPTGSCVYTSMVNGSAATSCDADPPPPPPPPPPPDPEPDAGSDAEADAGSSSGDPDAGSEPDPGADAAASSSGSTSSSSGTTSSSSGSTSSSTGGETASSGGASSTSSSGGAAPAPPDDGTTPPRASCSLVAGEQRSGAAGALLALVLAGCAVVRRRRLA